MCTYMLNLCVNVDEWVKWIVHACLCVCAAHVHTVSISVGPKYKERHVLYIFAQMFQTTKMCSCSNKCSLPQSRCWLTLMRAVCEKYTSKWAFENMSSTCSHWQSLKSWTLKKRRSLGRPRGIGWRGRWEGGSGWGIHLYPMLIHVNVWQKPVQYCKVISLQLI